MFTKKVTYKKAGNRCVEIHHHSGDTCHLYFYTNSPEPDNVIGTFVDKKNVNAMVEYHLCGSGEITTEEREY
tara:strand:- start:1616 stop:1831 length:216 start_codon:yes stop_codon:yes gene_type:complete